MTHNESSSFLLLASCQHGYISTCTCCHEYNFTYKNVLLRLSEEDLCCFCTWLMDNQQNSANEFNTPHGRNLLYCSPVSNVYLVFNLEELADIADMFNQVQLVLEARKIVTHH